jgi:hypothetical protein
MLSESAPTGDSTASKQTTQTAATVTEIGSRGRDSVTIKIILLLLIRTVQ